MKGRLFIGGRDVGEVELDHVSTDDLASEVPALGSGVTSVTVTATVPRETALRAVPEVFINAPGGRA